MTIPRCVAFIPDGNRRHAASFGKTSLWGHSRGLENLCEIARAAFEFGIEHVVVWGASESNLKRRPANEIAYLTELLKHELQRRLKDPEETRFYLRGAWKKHVHDEDLDLLVALLERETAHFTRRHFTLLFGYDGATENVEAVKDYLHRPFLFSNFSKQHINMNVIEALTEAELAKHRWTSHVPNVDMIIRTGVEGTPNESDPFLPFTKRNALLYFKEVRWPEFGKEHLLEIFEDYGKRSRTLRKGA